MSEQPEATASSKIPTSGHNESFAVLNSCLVDGDAEQRSRERQVRRRALAISIALQSTALMALLIIPLIGRTERISPTIFVPIPPYKQHRSPAQNPHPRTDGARTVSQLRFPTNIPPTIALRDHGPTGETPDTTEVGPPGFSDNPDGIQIVDTRPAQPPVEVRGDTQKKRLVVGHIEPAMILHRVEPLYPIIPKQLGRSGKVELRAIIATDGSIQSLEVVDGDPMFFQSALNAVSQWRYRPTILNGVPVEIDTHITVIYTVQR